MARPLSFPGSLSSGDPVERLVLALEHLDVAAGMVRSGRVAQQRMALVAADFLAEVLLQRHVDRTVAASVDLGTMTPRRFSNAERRELAADFGARVRFAQRQQGGFMSGFFPEPLLDGLDATLFRVAHGYRNALYHGDRHNPALTDPLARLYLQAAGRALVRSVPPGVVVGGRFAPGQGPEELRRFGWPGEGAVPLREAAEATVPRVVAGLSVDEAPLRDALIEDLGLRGREVRETLDGLPGFSRQELADFLRSVLAWAAHGADPQLVQLQDEQAARMEVSIASGSPVTDRERREFRANQRAQSARIDELARSFRAPVSLKTAEDLPRSGARQLRAAPGLPELVERYRQLDERLHVLEQAVAWMVDQWERHVSLQTDILRGK